MNPWLIHVNVWQKPLQYRKVISLQLIKINGIKIYKDTKASDSIKSCGNQRHSSWLEGTVSRELQGSDKG